MGQRTVKVYEVLADTDGDGPAGDGTVVFRFRREADAEKFAKENTCWGRPCKVGVTNAPLRLAQRWGMA